MKFHKEKNYVVLFVLIIVGLTFNACSGRKKAAKGQKKSDNVVSSEIPPPKIVKKFWQVKESVWQTFNAKTKIDYTSSARPLPISNFSATIRMQKDKFVWISVTVPIMGEVARALITSDSIKIIDRIRHRYLLNSISYLQKFSSVPLTLTNLQNALLANATCDIYKSEMDTSGGYVLVNYLDSAVSNLLMVSLQDLTIRKNKLLDLKKKQDFTADYDEFATIEGQLIPMKVSFRTENPEPATADIEYISVILNKDVLADFKIPSSYKPWGE